MAVDAAREILIARPRAAVAAYMFDPTHDAEWASGVEVCQPITPGRLRQGSRVQRKVQFLGQHFDDVYEVTADDGDRAVELRATKPIPMRITYLLGETATGTLVRIHARGNAGGFLRLATPLLSIIVSRSIARDLSRLKRRLESQPATSASDEPPASTSPDSPTDSSTPDQKPPEPPA